MRAESGFLKGLNPTMAAWARFVACRLRHLRRGLAETAGGA